MFENINSQVEYDPNIIKEIKAYSNHENESYYNLNTTPLTDNQERVMLII